MINFDQIKNQINQRIRKYSINTKEISIKNLPHENKMLQEFDSIQEWRFRIWYKESKLLDHTISALLTNNTVEYTALLPNEDFIPAPLFTSKLSREPEITAFNYNCISPNYYNASYILWDDLRFLALEAPLDSSAMLRFNQLFTEHPVTELVRLTPEYENRKFPDNQTKKILKCYPYWRENNDNVVNNGYLTFHSSGKSRSVRSFPLEDWIDNASGDPKILLDLILNIRKTHKPTGSLIAVHCHSGVSRTGTFIAAFILIDEIEKQLGQGIKIESVKISIENVVRKLSLQRYHMVSRQGYIMLYKVVSLYCSLKNEMTEKPIMQKKYVHQTTHNHQKPTIFNNKAKLIKVASGAVFAASALLFLYKIAKRKNTDSPTNNMTSNSYR